MVDAEIKLMFPRLHRKVTALLNTFREKNEHLYVLELTDTKKKKNDNIVQYSRFLWYRGHRLWSK